MKKLSPQLVLSLAIVGALAGCGDSSTASFEGQYQNNMRKHVSVRIAKQGDSYLVYEAERFDPNKPAHESAPLKCDLMKERLVCGLHQLHFEPNGMLAYNGGSYTRLN